MKNVVIATAVLVVILIAAFFMIKKPELMVETAGTPTASSQATEAAITLVSMEELAKHSNSNDCWLAIDGIVYDVTAFIPNHPGKDEILKGCGLDATAYFATKGEKGLPHSQRAVDIREEFKIGTLGTSI